MNNKKVLGVFIILFFLAVFAYSKQEPPSKPITADDIVAKMQIQLGLTDDQAVKVKPIIENYLDQERQLYLDEKKQLSKVLTGQQLFTWDFIQNDKPKDKKKHSL